MLAGVLGSAPEGLLSYNLPKDATISVVLLKAVDCSKAVRAPTFDKRGVPKVCTMHVVQFGKERPVLRWQAQEAKPLPAGQPTKVVRVACIKHFVVDAVWKDSQRTLKVRSRPGWPLCAFPRRTLLTFSLQGDQSADPSSR